MLYTLLHEGGHALVAVLYGGKINRLVLGFNAHVTYTGANFTRTGEALMNSAGALLPTVCMGIALAVYDRNVKHFVYHYLFALFSLAVTGSFAAWVAIPLISLFSAPPAGDDVTKFLEVSGMDPLLVSGIALLLIIAFVYVAYKKGLYTKFKEHLKAPAPSKAESAGRNKFLAVGLALAGLILVSAVLAAHLAAPEKVLELNISMNIHEDRKSLQVPFEVRANRPYSIHLDLDAEGMITDILICDDKGNIIYQNISEWFELSTVPGHPGLKTGNYTLVANFIRDPEALLQYFDDKGYDFSQEQMDGFMEVLKKKQDDEYVPVSLSVVIE